MATSSTAYGTASAPTSRCSASSSAVARGRITRACRPLPIRSPSPATRSRKRSGIERGRARLGRGTDRGLAAGRTCIRPIVALALLAAVPRLFNLLALDPFIDEVGWLHWTVHLFDPSNPSTFWLPVTLD